MLVIIEGLLCNWVVVIGDEVADGPTGRHIFRFDVALLFMLESGKVIVFSLIVAFFLQDIGQESHQWFQMSFLFPVVLADCAV